MRCLNIASLSSVPPITAHMRPRQSSMIQVSFPSLRVCPLGRYSAAAAATCALPIPRIAMLTRYGISYRVIFRSSFMMRVPSLRLRLCTTHIA